ncbi:MAG: phosphoglycolate phosphatase [Betaproteobacteria bacterium]|nr:phosphoglycolate phosphatase [Betaproteobacteria bacterium]
MKAALFDLDGTLADTAPDTNAAANAMLRDLALPELPPAEAKKYIGDGMNRFVKRALTRQRRGEPPPELLARALARMEFHYRRECEVNRGGAYEGVCETLAALKKLGVRLGCVTNKPKQFTPRVLKACGLDSFFGAVVSGDSLPQKKPDPAPLREACRQLDAACAETWMVGDSPADAKAAAAAGCFFAAAAYGYHGENLHPAARVVYNFAEVLSAISGIK